MSFCVMIPSCMLFVAQVRVTQNISGSHKKIVTVPSRDTVISQVTTLLTIYHARTSPSTSRSILSLNKALPNI
jgi:hypothetical protein